MQVLFARGKKCRRVADGAGFLQEYQGGKRRETFFPDSTELSNRRGTKWDTVGHANLGLAMMIVVYDLHYLLIG